MAEINRELWPGWETVRLIGQGSFGAVYEIRREVRGRTEHAALKVLSIPQNSTEITGLRTDGYDDESITKYFAESKAKIEEEYAMMAEMKGHPNIVYCDDIRTIQKEDGFGWDIYIKMELLTPMKRSLGEEISQEQTIKVGKDLCGALEQCEKLNIVHRDIKPENIFVSRDGNYKLGDFGIAKTMEGTTGGTKTGTYDYMAPEVYNNKPYHYEADIYSLGLVLYWMLNGRTGPFLSTEERATPKQKAEARDRRYKGERLPAPKQGSSSLKRIVLKACAFDPKDRYKSAEEMLRDLERVERGEEIEGAGNEEKPEKKPRKWVYGVIAAILILAVTAGILIAKDNQSKKETSAEQNGQDEEIKLSAETEEIVNKQLEAGDIVSFGTYEQDNDTSDGEEEIEWQVLDVEEGKSLLISRYALDCRPYNNTGENEHGSYEVSWETCSLRSWLNSTFLNSAFSEEEQALILTTLNKADSIRNTGSDYGEYGKELGNDTNDKVFILSITEAEKYFISDSSRICIPTEYATAWGANTSGGRENVSCLWWLRLSDLNYSAPFVNYAGNVSGENGPVVDTEYVAVRPVIWVDSDSSNDILRIMTTEDNNLIPNEQEEQAEQQEMTTEEASTISGGEIKESRWKDLQAGDIITLGNYEQDNNTTNGKEGIEWLVLYVKDEKALLLSRYALDCQPYNEKYEETTWETCSLRTWLNDTFLNEAFSPDEQAEIAMTTVKADNNPDYGTYAGNDTKDKIFLLSIQDTFRWYSLNSEVCSPTDYAAAKGDYNTYTEFYVLNSKEKALSFSMWLRSPGDSQYTSATCNPISYYNEEGDDVNSTDNAVRPAMWIKTGTGSESPEAAGEEPEPKVLTGTASYISPGKMKLTGVFTVPGDDMYILSFEIYRSGYNEPVRTITMRNVFERRVDSSIGFEFILVPGIKYSFKTIIKDISYRKNISTGDLVDFYVPEETENEIPELSTGETVTVPGNYIHSIYKLTGLEKGNDYRIYNEGEGNFSCTIFSSDGDNITEYGDNNTHQFRAESDTVYIDASAGSEQTMKIEKMIA